jgi:hypothetical protein
MSGRHNMKEAKPTKKGKKVRASKRLARKALKPLVTLRKLDKPVNEADFRWLESPRKT